MNGVVLHQGDCLAVMRGLPDASVDAVVTDPPYGVGYASWDASVPPQVFLDECLRIARGPVLLFGGALMVAVSQVMRFIPQPERIVIWAPSFSLGSSRKHGMYYRWHPIWCWRLPKKQDGLVHDVTRVRCEGRHWWNHPATKPVDLMRQLVSTATVPGGTILDPFMGSGTTGVACVQEGRDFIGIEREPEYFAISQRRIATAQPPLPMQEVAD